jgi:AcrR family transcriptional regulator
MRASLRRAQAWNPKHVPTRSVPKPARTAARTSARNTKRLPTSTAREADGHSRREAILLAAERLFAQRGYHAVSIRDVATEAGVPLALVGYHYGQKHELFHAIFEHWSDTLVERLDELARVREHHRDASPAQRLRAIVEAFVRPVLRLRASAEGEYYALLVGRELSFNHPDVDSVLRRYFDPLADAFIQALAEVFDHAPRGHLAWCYQFALGALLHHLTDKRVERLSNFQDRIGDPLAGDMLVEFLTSGIRGAMKAVSGSLPG